MPTNLAEPMPKAKNRLGIAVRALAPIVPLGIALIHGAATPGKPTPTLGPIAHNISLPSLAECEKTVPCPLAAKGKPVMWWFVFKLNAKAFPGCGGGTRSCPFGGDVQSDPKYAFGQQYVVATSGNSTLQDGVPSCLGTTTADPVGASFDEIYSGKYHYVIWNDQPYGDPTIAPCTSKGNCAGPWGHSKGILAWNDDGEGFVMQVTTPSWPESGNPHFPRQHDGNTLGCVKDDNVTFSQHFFALRLSKDDLVLVLHGMAGASVVTDPDNSQIVNNGGPSDVQELVNSLGKKTDSDALIEGTLSTGARFISKPSAMNVPPWQLVSAQLGGIALRTATFWANPKIPTTTDNSIPECWDETLGTPGPVAIATSGSWNNIKFNLTGAPGANHAKIGVSTSGPPYAIFGDENQQGTLSGNCKSSQDGRGGMFFALSDSDLANSIRGLIDGTTGATDTSKSPGTDTTEKTE
jgi:hypothetical protein